MKKQPERTALTRNVLIETFLEISEEKPIDKITVSELASKAGYNRSTFYEFIRSRFVMGSVDIHPVAEDAGFAVGDVFPAGQVRIRHG